MLKTAVPMLAGTLALSGYNIADTYFIGKLGEDPLAAVGFTIEFEDGERLSYLRRTAGLSAFTGLAQ